MGDLESRNKEGTGALEKQPTEVMQKMREMMGKADEQVEAKKTKKVAAQKRKEEARKKEVSKEARKSKSVIEEILSDTRDDEALEVNGGVIRIR